MQKQIELPYPDKAKGKNNNRKQSFDRECRALLFKVCQRNGLQLDEIPSYGGRTYLEKQDLKKLDDDNVYRKLQGHWIIGISIFLNFEKCYKT